MGCGRMSGIKKRDPEDEQGEIWQSTLLDTDSRLRVARGFGDIERTACGQVFTTLKQRRGHPEGPPPTISDGWGGIDDAMLAVYGVVRAYPGRGRPPSRKLPQAGWQYLQMVKQRDEHWHLKGIELRSIFGEKAELIAALGKSTAYVERSHLTARTFNSRLVRSTLAFSKNLNMHLAAACWQDCFYNWVRPHKSLRLAVVQPAKQRWLPRTPGMAANLTDHIWSFKDVLTVIPVPKHT